MRNQITLNLSTTVILTFALLGVTFLNGLQNHPVETIDKISTVISIIFGGADFDLKTITAKAASPENPAAPASLSEASAEASYAVSSGSDQAAPIVEITGVREGATYPLGFVPEIYCVSTDTQSNVDVPALLSFAGGPAGLVTASCSQAADFAGNMSAPISVTYTVINSTFPRP